MPLIQSTAWSIDAWLTAATLIVPSSSISIFAPVVSVISRITLPPVPITSRILSAGIFIVTICGANSLVPSRASVRALAISPRMWIRPSLACSRAIFMISSVIEVILISICSEVIPSFVPATLKSISPRWSSSPRMSDRTAKSSPSLIRPIAIPATALARGTPASIMDSDVPQTVAIEDEPFDSVISDTVRIVYGKSSALGSIGLMARHASLP